MRRIIAICLLAMAAAMPAAAQPTDISSAVADYNMIPGQDTSNFQQMDPSGRLCFISSWDLREGVSHISETKPGNLLDGFAIGRFATDEYIPGSLHVMAIDRALDMSRERFIDRVSDHLPMIARFRINADDD